MSLTTTSPFWFSSGATSAGGGGTVVYPYSIDQSLRFDGSSAYLNFTPASSTAGTFTVSFWVKRTKLGVAQYAYYSGAVNQRGGFGFDANDKFFVAPFNSSGANANLFSDMLFRDVGAWYHIVIEANAITYSNLSTAMKIYVNGQIITHTKTQLSTPSGGDRINDTQQKFIGALTPTPSSYFSGYLAEWNWIDGTALDASNFGETINGIWVPKSYSGSYGSAGYYLSFADSSAIGDDLSGNTNDWAANNLAASDVVPDSPTNNFATWNVTGVQYGGTNAPTISEGSLKAATSGNPTHIYSTFAIEPTDTQGYYWEVKAISLDSARSYMGIVAPEGSASGTAIGSYQFYKKFVLNMNGNLYGNNDVSSTNVVALTSWTTNDILMFAYKNGKFWIGKNGTWMNSGDPAAGTGDIVAQDGGRPSDRGDVTWYPYVGYNSTYTANFGQEGTFAGTETAGGNSDENGHGDFKYSVPSGFLAMCSANLSDPAIGPQLASGEQSDNYFEAIKYIGNGGTQHIGSGGAQHPVDVVTVGNSCRFNSSDSARFNNSSRPAGDRQQFTISFWFKQGKLGVQRQFFEGSMDSGHGFFASFNSSNQLYLYDFNVASGGFQIYGGRAYTDTSKWYNMVIAVDTTQATNSDRIKVWVDNEQIDLSAFTTGAGASSWPDQNSNFTWNSGGNTSIGYGNSSYWDGYLAEFVNIDGSVLDPTSFGQYGSNGYWIPKDVSGLTFGDEGFYLDFSDNSTATALGTDSSGNANNFSATNIATTDQMGDSPTQNFNTLNPKGTNYINYAVTLSEGNLKAASLQSKRVNSMLGVSSGKWYFETKSQNENPMVGVALRDGSNSIVYDGAFGYVRNYAPINGSPTNRTGYATWTTTDIIGVAFDVDNNQVEFFKNNTSIGTFDFVMNSETVATAGYQGGTNVQITFNFGADDTFAGNATGGAGAADGNGYGSFYYTPPTGYLALVDDNIPVEGLTGPDFVWIKNRDVAADHYLVDSVRGDYKQLISNSTAAESTNTNNGTKLDYDGFTVGALGDTNSSGKSYVSWNWKAGGKANTFNVDGTGYASMAAAGLTDGSIALSGLSVNTTAGFSIINYTGNGTNGATISHNLGVTPDHIIIKRYSTAEAWVNWHKSFTATQYLRLYQTNAVDTATTLFNSTLPSDSVITLGTGGFVNTLNEDYICYAFAEKEGFSKFGTYVGNASTNGPFVYTGFKPAFVLLKVSSAANNWFIYDNKREGYNPDNNTLSPNLDTVEDTSYKLDLVSNGFKIRGSNNAHNQSGQTFIYLAFAEQPFKYANAR